MHVRLKKTTDLKVAMYDVMEVAVFHSRDDLVEEPPRLVGLQLHESGQVRHVFTVSPIPIVVRAGHYSTTSH